MLSRGSEILLDRAADLVPGQPLVTHVPLERTIESTELEVALLDAHGQVLRDAAAPLAG